MMWLKMTCSRSVQNVDSGLSGEVDTGSGTGMETQPDKGLETLASLKNSCETPIHVVARRTFETPAVEKGKKLGIKRVKKKPNLNISTGKLKSVTTPKSFSFLNMSVQKQTLRANNRALAQDLAKARQNIRWLSVELQTLRSQQQEQDIELNRLRRLVGMKDEQIQLEVRQRIQDEMCSMKSLIEELTQSLMQSSRYITKMNDKCMLYNPKSSTDSARSLSPGNSQDNPTLNPLNTRDQVKRSDLYLLKADTFFVPRDGGIFNDDAGMANMSIIAEQSMLDTDEEMYTAQLLPSVEEMGLQESAPLSKPISKLPQRVLATKLDTSVNLSESATNPYTNSSELESVTSEMGINSNTISGKEVNEKEEKIKTKEKVRSKNSRTGKPKSAKDPNNEAKCDKDKNKETIKSNNSKHSRTEDQNVDKSNNVKDKKEQVGNNRGIRDHTDLDADISAFGFGGSFVTDLVSGSPIYEEKRGDTIVKVQQPGPIVSKLLGTSEDKSHRETVAVPKARNVTGKKDSKNGGGVKKELRNIEKSNSSTRQKINGSSIQNANKSVLKHGSKQSRKETYATENPFVSKKPNVERSPVKTFNGAIALHNDKNPFKPTRTLLRSPVHVTVERAVPESRDPLAFLATLRESLDSRSKESSPLPQPMFHDEPTTYFNSEMEFTTVIDSSKLIQSLSRSERNDPIVSMANEPEPINETHSDKQSNSREDLELQNAGEKESVKMSDAEMQEGSCDVAVVELRTNKPGVFTFSVARKEADGTRKPVPENVSKARSKKKKKPVSPEKDERKTGSDRDMFNFGDRTPTMPLTKIYDLSMNESVAVPTVSLKNFKEKEDTKLPKPKPEDHIYYLPLKGSPDEKPVSTHSRSKSRSRSKSLKSADNDDEDWVPEGKARARSQSRSKKTHKEEISRSRSQSRRRVVQDLETDEEAGEEKSRSRSKSVSRKTETEASTYRRGRSQSRSRVVKDNEKAEDVDEHVSVAKSRTRSKSASRKECNDELAGSRHSRSKSKTRAYLRGEAEDEVESHEVEMKSKEKMLTEPINRGSRSRTRVRNNHEIETDTVISELTSVKCDSDNGPAPRRSARSKLCITKIVEDEASPEIQRKSRSRLIGKRTTNKSNVEEEDNQEKREIFNSKNTKHASSTDLDMKNSENTEVSNTLSCMNVIDLDEIKNEESANNILTVVSESSEDSINPRHKTVTEKHKAFVIEDDSESGSENIRKCETLRRKSRRRIKSAKYGAEINIETEQIEDKKLEDCVDDTLENNRHRNVIDSAFISRRRGMSARMPSQDDHRNYGDEFNGNENTEKQTDNTEIENLSLVCDKELDGTISETLKVRNKVEERKTAKSTKKSTKKRTNAGDKEPKSGKSRVNMIEKFDPEDISKPSTETVTPAVRKDVNKKSSRSSRTAKGTKAMTVECLPDQTPVTKEERYYQGSDKMSTLALLKKRLTMAGKHRVQEDSLSNDLESRKRSQTDFVVPDGQLDTDGSPDSKRTRRNKTPISYVTKPLNAKLRQGDRMFQDTMSKVKAEQSRLVIARKISMPQISRGDKENIVHK